MDKHTGSPPLSRVMNNFHEAILKKKCCENMVVEVSYKPSWDGRESIYKSRNFKQIMAKVEIREIHRKQNRKYVFWGILLSVTYISYIFDKKKMNKFEISGDSLEVTLMQNLAFKFLCRIL